MFSGRTMNNRINHLQERVLRITYSDYTTPFKELLRSKQTLTIHERNIHNVAIEMFKVKKEVTHEFISGIFQIQNGPNTRSQRDFVWPNANTVYKGELSLRNFGPIVWDQMLPNSFKSCTTLSEFKLAIKNWIPENCHCRLCKDYIQGLGFVNIV